jgi:hypothetical protein
MGRTWYICYHEENKIHLLSWREQDTFVIIGRTRYICYHGENKIHLLSWGEQDTFVIMGRTRYMWYHGENKIHLLSCGEQDTIDGMIMMSPLFLTNTLSWILTQTHYSSAEPTSLCLYSLVLLSREAINTNAIVFGLTWLGLEPRFTRSIT